MGKQIGNKMQLVLEERILLNEFNLLGSTASKTLPFNSLFIGLCLSSNHFAED